MAQILVPAADVAVGSWTPAINAWASIDDDSGANPTGDGQLVTSDAVGNNTNTTNLDVSLATGTDPASSTGHILRVRWNCSGTQSLAANCELWQGVPDTGSLVASLTVTPTVGATEIESTHSLTAGEADAISDYTDLHLRLWGRGTAGGPARSLVVDLAELETPDAGTPPVALAGTATAAAAATGTAELTRALTGTSTAAMSAAAVTAVTRPVAGAATAAATAAAELTVTGAGGGPVSLDAETATAAQAAAQLSTGRAHSGSITSAATSQAALTVTRGLSGAAPVAGSTTGDLDIQGSVSLSGAAPAGASTTADLATIRPLTGVSTTAGGVAADLATTRPLDGVAVAATGAGAELGGVGLTPAGPTPEARIYRVPAEGRGYQIPAEARVRCIPAEDRTYRIVR
jgi:hypothetical protein